jgi:hypothetical protein
MRFFNKHFVNTTPQSNSKIIILLSSLVGVLLATPTATIRFKEYSQPWRFSRNTEPDWKVQYDTTTGTSAMASDTNKEMVNLFRGLNSEGGGAEIKTRQNNGTNIYWEITVDNAGGRRNVSGVRRSDVGAGMDKPLPGINISDAEDRNKDQMQTGRLGLQIDVSGDERGKRHMEQDTVMTRSIKEMFEQFYEVEGYLTELLDFEGNMLSVLLKFVFRIKSFIKIMKNRAGNVRINIKFRRAL